jgi:hypothetical protein
VLAGTLLGITALVDLGGALLVVTLGLLARGLSPVGTVRGSVRLRIALRRSSAVDACAARWDQPAHRSSGAAASTALVS